jgi:hypothetical protein
MKTFFLLVLIFCFSYCATNSDAQTNNSTQYAEKKWTVPLAWTAIPTGKGAGQSQFISSEIIYCLTYGNGRLVAGGKTYGKLAYSDNGIDWTIIPAGTGADKSQFSVHDEIERISYVKDRFYAIGRTYPVGAVDIYKTVYSFDGINWTISDDYIQPYIIGNKYFTYKNNNYVYSDNGKDWMVINERIRPVAYGYGIFVAMQESGANGKIAYSNDCKHWTIIPEGTGAGQSQFIGGGYLGSNGIDDILWGNGMFVAYNRVMVVYSDNGKEWTVIPIGSNADLNHFLEGNLRGLSKINYVGNKFIASGYYGNMAHSNNGKDWIAILGGTGAGKSQLTKGIRNIAYGGGRYIAYEWSGGNMAYSDNGKDWIAVPAGTGTGKSQFTSNDTIWDISWDGQRFIICGNNGKIVYSNIIE